MGGWVVGGCPCPLHADWCLQSDVVTNVCRITPAHPGLHLQDQVNTLNQRITQLSSTATPANISGSDLQSASF